jgi:phage shock protein PspC (stress-responsive transcriptional regulator)
MKKIININFHGRVVPIEESAYEILKQYIESLRKYFANEEGRDEIINDIENRFAELFSERLKKDANCITDDDVNAIIGNMGRPADFEAADADSSFGTSSSTDNKQSTQSEQSQKTYTTYTAPPGRGRLYRNADDKILGGVCSGLANYLSIDPVILRIIFVVLVGALFWIYILLWIVVPSQSQQSNITKRLFRSADDKVIGGVAGGLAAYFNIQVWIPRLVFALPFVLGLFSGIFHAAFWDWDFAPRFISGGLGSTLIISYIILWIAVPIASTASEKLEMRGERVDLNSIANTIKEDLEGFKGRAEKMGNDIKEGAQKFSTEFKSTAQQKSKDLSYEISQRRSGGIGHVIGVLFKAFFLFIASIIALSLFGVLIGLLFGGIAVLPLKNFFLAGVGENFLAWLSLVLFLGVPLIAILTWLIRRIMGARSKNHYLGFVFGTLWVIGLISLIILFTDFVRNFRAKDFVEESVSIAQPVSGKLYVDETNARRGLHYFSRRWDWVDWDNDWPIFGDNYDSLLLNTVRVDVVKSKDSFFHVQKLKFSRGRSQKQAQSVAEKINFDIAQQDSVLLLPRGGFPISQNEKFRNQQVLVIIEVPVGKKIQIDGSVHNYGWFNINIRRNGWTISDDDEWNNDEDERYEWEANTEYIMTAKGLERTDKKRYDSDDDENDSKQASPKTDNGYRYKGNSDSSKTQNQKEPAKRKDETPHQKSAKPAEQQGEKAITSAKESAGEDDNGRSASPGYFLSLIFQ